MKRSNAKPVAGRLGAIRVSVASVALSIGLALVPAIFAQAPPQLLVEVGPNQIRIIASHVSYGDVLRALQEKFGWKTESPRSADEMKLSHIVVEAKTPKDALAKLLAGSKLDYAFVGVSGSILKLLIIPSQPDDVVTQATPLAPSILGDPESETSSSPLTPSRAVKTGDRTEGASVMSLSEITDLIGVPPGTSASDVGRMKTFPIADAAGIMGVPAGMSPGNVGRMQALPISQVANIIGVQPGIPPSDVGKTLPVTSSLSGLP